jgi:hypothetical protein
MLAARYEGIVRFLSLGGMGFGIVGLCLALVIAVADPSRRPWSGANVSTGDIQAHLDGKAATLDIEIDSVRVLFPNFDDERWRQARPLIASWVNEYGVSRDEKLEFIADLKRAGLAFPQERRAEALDAYHALKLDKVLRSSRRVDRWLGPLRVVEVLFAALLLIGIFCVAFALIDNRRTASVRTLPEPGEASAAPALPTAFCTGCGARIAASVAVCPSCGAKQAAILASS